MGIRTPMAIRNILLIPGLFLLLLSLSCSPEREEMDPGYIGGLVFSGDTIFFDTLFTSVGSTTKRLKVYNPNEKALLINKIYLGAMTASPYTITVNGIEGKIIEGQRILGKDSLLILIQVRINPEDQDLPFLVTDSIIFETNEILQNVQLVSWGQDAEFLGNEVLPCNTIWNAGRPYVLFQSVLVDTLCSLEIQAGTRIYASFDAFLYVKGTLNVRGDSIHRVIFRNERREPVYENVPGQWGGIVFLEGSHDNRIAYTNIKNAQYGIRLGTPDNDTIPDLIIKNTKIENMSHSGMLSFTSDLLAVNTLVSNCKYFTSGNIAGGNYRYVHCTFVNYGQSFFTETPAFVASNYLRLDDGSTISEPLRVSLINTIVYGNLDEEVLLNDDGNTLFIMDMSTNLLKTNLPEMDDDGNILNEDPEFIDIWEFNYKLDSLSPAINAGIKTGVLVDLDGTKRDSLPDIGAYERIE